MTFTFIDLFAGIGGFHAAMGAAGGECWFASEIDPLCRNVYADNWGLEPAGDIVPLTEERMDVPPHDVLAAGFPCQPFSKSGFQRGMEETRGTLFFNILKVLEHHKPPVIVLENVRNLAGPRQAETWKTIVRNLRDVGYRVSDLPAVFSPHLLPADRGGRPQVRERVFITGTYVGRDQAWREAGVAPIVTPKSLLGWSRPTWDLETDLPLDDDATIPDLETYQLNETELGWLDMWNEWLALIDEPVPGFPIWADAFEYPAVIPPGTPAWKETFLRKNAELFHRNEGPIRGWLEKYDYLKDVPASRRKLEWQAKGPDGEKYRDLYECVLHMRPSGIRAKRPTYLPALVAITQTSIYGPRKRRITPTEAARLQGLPDWFDFGKQPQAATYRQLGNGVNVGAAYYVFREHVLRDAQDIRKIAPHLLDAVLQSGPEPVVTKRHGAGAISDEMREPQRTPLQLAVARHDQVRLEQNAEGSLINR